jgi:hypothetical protein
MLLCAGGVVGGGGWWSKRLMDYFVEGWVGDIVGIWFGGLKRACRQKSFFFCPQPTHWYSSNTLPIQRHNKKGYCDGVPPTTCLPPELVVKVREE